MESAYYYRPAVIIDGEAGVIDDNKKRFRAVGAAAVLGLALPLGLLYWMWPSEEAPALQNDGMPGPLIPFSIEKITEEEAGREVVAASDFQLVESAQSGTFTTDGGFGNLVTMPTSGEAQDEGESAPSPGRSQPGNMAVSTVGSGVAGPSGGVQPGRQRGPSGPVQIARIGGGGGGGGGGALPSLGSSEPAAGDSAPESPTSEPLVTAADDPDLLREPADGPVPQAVACANEAAGLQPQEGEPAVDCEPGEQVAATPAAPSIPSVPNGGGGGSGSGAGGGSNAGGTGGAGGGEGGSGSGQPEGTGPSLAGPSVPEGAGGEGEGGGVIADASGGGQGEGQGGGGQPEQSGGGGGASEGEGETVVALAAPVGTEPSLLQETGQEEVPVAAATAVPEPGSLILALTALAGIGAARRKSGAR